MSNFFDAPDPYSELPRLVEYCKTHSPTQMLSDIRSSCVNPNDLPALGDFLRVYLSDEIKTSLPNKGIRHARVLYAEGISQLEANPRLVAPDVSLLSAKWSFVACCHDLQDELAEAFRTIQSEPTFVRTYPDLAFSVAFLLWREGQLQETGAILRALDALPEAYVASKFDEAGLDIAAFEKLKLWVSEQQRKNRR
jgi:hypothetical protein